MRSSGSSRASAQTAAPRTKGAASARRLSATPARPGFTAVADRDQHIAQEAVAADRLIGEPAKRARKPASSSVAELGEIGACEIGALPQLREKRRPWRTCSKDRPRGNRRSHRSIADQRPELGRDGTLVLDGEIGDAAPGIDPIGRRKGCVGQASRQRRHSPQ